MSKIKTWLDKPITKGDVVKSNLASLAILGGYYAWLYYEDKKSEKARKEWLSKLNDELESE